MGSHVQIVEDERMRMLVQVLETLLEMRTQRMGLIQTEDQLRFSVEALILALKRLQGEEVSWPFVGGNLKDNSNLIFSWTMSEILTLKKLRFCFQDGRAVGGKRLATSEREGENLAEEEEEEERLERPEAKKRKNSES